VAKTTGSGDKLKTAFTNLKEVLGAPFERALAPTRTFFAELINGWSEAKRKKDEYDQAAKAALLDQSISGKDFLSIWDEKYGKNAAKKAKETLSILTGALNAAGSNADEVNKVLATAQDELGLSADKVLALNDAYGVFGKETNAAIGVIRKEIETRLAARRAVEESLAAYRKQQDEKAAADAKEADANAKAKAHIDKVTAAREAAVQQIELQAKAEGKEADQLEIINAYVSSYVSLIGESEGLVSENNSASKELLATIKALATEYERTVLAQAKLKEEAETLKASVKSALDAISEDVTGSEKMKQQLAALDALQESAISNEQITVDEKLAIQEEYFEKRKILLGQIEAAEKAESAAEVADRRAKTIESLEIANTFAQQYQQIMTDIQALVSEQIANEEKIKTAELQKQYEAGAISAEEYEEKLTDIKRQAAKDKYKIDMWTWSANIAAAIANTALAATKALADGGGLLGAVLAAAVIAAGGVQLASLIAAKPIPPAFASGGIVPGTSYTGDKVVGRLNSGEMVWNAAQQKALWNKVQSGDWGSDGVRVQVYNSASNLVRAEPTVDQDGIRIAIRQVVNKDMADGRFNTSMRRAQQGMRGTRYTN